MAADPDDEGTGSVVFTYGAPFVGVLLVAVGIAAAVPGAYAIIQEDITTCGDPTIAVDSPGETEERFGEEPRPGLVRLPYDTLSDAERAAFDEARDSPIGEARVDGAFPNRETFENGTLVVYQERFHYATLVAENPCFEVAPLQFPLGVFAIALGVIGILTPPGYRKLVELEEGLA